MGIARLRDRSCVVVGDGPLAEAIAARLERDGARVHFGARHLNEQPVDVLVTALDVRHEAPFLDLTDEAWTEVLDGTVKAAFLASQDAARAMRDAGGGVIVHVTSDLPLRPPSGAAAHAAAQAALQMMSTTMALDLAPDNVRVCAVAAPESDTDVTDEDVAAVVAFCASGEASYVLGSVFHPGGGAPVRS